MKVVALSNINHDGTTYEKGSTLEVSDSQGQQLLDVGAAASADKNQPADNTGNETPPAPTREQVLSKKSRKQLNKIAADAGVAEPEKVNNIPNLVTAIVEAEGSGDEDTENDEGGGTEDETEE